MTATFRSLCAFLISLFGGLEAFANAFANLGKVAEESSGAYVDESRIARQIAANKHAKELAASALPLQITAQ